MEYSDDGEPPHAKRSEVSSRKTRHLVTWLIALVGLLSIYLVLARVWRDSPECALNALPSHGDPLHETSYTCGNTTASARLNNCSFDPLSFAWLPKQCCDDHVSQAFLWLRNWTWYFDAEGNQPAPYEEVINGQHDRLYVTVEHHVLHCMYMWREMHRAVSEGWLLDGKIGDFDHADYCERMLILGLKKGEDEVVDEVVEMKWPDCPVIW